MTTATKEQIRGVLETLDHEDDNNWTSEGLPRVEVVAESVFESDHDATVGRAAITDAAPHFRRGEPDLPSDDDDAAEDEGHTSAGDADVAAQVSAADKAGAEAVTVGQANADKEARRRALDRSIALGRAELVSLNEDRVAVEDAVAKVTAKVDGLVNQKLAEFPPVTPSDAVKAHLRSEQRQRALRAGISGQLREMSETLQGGV